MGGWDEVIKALLELIGRLALGSVKGSKQKKIHCDNIAESAHVRVGTVGAPVFISIFPLELLVASRIVAAFAKLTKGSWIYRVFMENGFCPLSAFVLALLWCVLQCNLGFACPATNCVCCVCFAGSNLPMGSATALQFYFCGTT